MSGNSTNGFLGRLRVQLPRLAWNLRKVLRLSPPKGDVYYGDAAALYDAERAQTGRWQREQAAVSGFLDRLPQGLSVLDVPLGTGRFIDFYRARGHAVTGLDASDEMMAVAAQRAGDFPLTTVRGSATDLPWPDGAFDLVVSTRFLRHILPYGLARQALAEMARVCRSHAIIELGLRQGQGRSVADHKPMRDNLSREQVIDLLAQSGFDVVDEVTTTRRFPGKLRIVFLLRKRG